CCTTTCNHLRWGGRSLRPPRGSSWLLSQVPNCEGPGAPAWMIYVLKPVLFASSAIIRRICRLRLPIYVINLCRTEWIPWKTFGCASLLVEIVIEKPVLDSI